jgi:SAM-dependent methyltransferase
MYARLIPGIELQTAGLPWATPAEATARQFGANFHHYIDIEDESFAEKLPDLAGTFDAVIFCEVIEHIRASPQEQITDLLGLLRPGGYLIVSTQNGIWRGWVARLMTGRRLDTIYSRQKRKAGNGRDFHVREYTPLELREAITEAGGDVLEEGLFDWYGKQPDHPLQQVSGRQAMLFVVHKKPQILGSQAGS